MRSRSLDRRESLPQVTEGRQAPRQPQGRVMHTGTLALLGGAAVLVIGSATWTTVASPLPSSHVLGPAVVVTVASDAPRPLSSSGPTSAPAEGAAPAGPETPPATSGSRAPTADPGAGRGAPDASPGSADPGERTPSTDRSDAGSSTDDLIHARPTTAPPAPSTSTPARPTSSTTAPRSAAASSSTDPQRVSVTRVITLPASAGEEEDDGRDEDEVPSVVRSATADDDD